MKRNLWLTCQHGMQPSTVIAMSLLACSALDSHPVRAADDRGAASTINHAFATELGTGFYDIGGRSVFIATIAPSIDVRPAQDSRAAVRLVLPMAGGSFDFVPDDAIEGRLPRHIDSYSITPGIEVDFPLRRQWVLTPWVRAGASFTANTSDGLLYGAGVRVVRDFEQGDRKITQLHELGLVNVTYRHQDDDSFLRLRNAIDLRRPTWSLGERHRLMAGLYGILDVVPDPPAAPAGVKPSPVQLELGFSLNGEPRPQLGWLRWPRLGLGYRFAGEFSGWRIVIGAPF
jgi:hypothetical protein